MVTSGGVLDGKVALITAAASGMGRASALLFASEGAQVIAADVNQETLEAVVAEITSAGGNARGYLVDLTDREQIDAFIATILGEYEVIDVLYNHAGLRGPTQLDLDYDSWMRCVMINLWAPTILTQQLLPLLRKSRAASIIYTSSQAGLGGVSQLPTYSATKAGLINFMKSMAILLGPEGIRSNAICPGATDTVGMNANNSPEAIERLSQHIPLRRMGKPSELAAVALFLASDASAYVNGVAVPVDGGASA